MIRSRFLLSGLGLLLLTAVGAGVYLYHNLPALLQLQAQHYLQQYGVDQFEFEGLHVTHNDASVDTLLLRGEYANFTYQLRLNSGQARYNWRTLFDGKVDSLTLTSLDISVTQSGPGSGQNSGVIDVEKLLPKQLIAQLPLLSLAIAHWTVDYRSPTVHSVAAEGSLHFNQHLDVRLNATLAGRELLVALRSDLSAEDLRLNVSLGENAADIATLSARLTRATSDSWEWALEGQAQHTPLLAWLRRLDTERALALGIPAATELSIQGETQFTASIRHANELDLSAPHDSGEALLQQLTANFRLSNEIRQLDIRDTIDSLSGTLDIEGTLAQGHIDATVRPFTVLANLSTQQLSLPENTLQWLRWETTVPIRVETTDVATITTATNWSMQIHNALLSLGDKDTQATLQKLDLDITATDPGRVQTATQLSASLSTRLHQQTLPQLEIAFTQHGDFEQSTFNLRVADTAESMHTTLSGMTSLASGSGQYQLHAQIADLPYFTETVTPLLRHFKLLDESVAIRSGVIRLDTALKSETFDMSDWEQRSQLTLENVAGSVNEKRFEGLALSADWSGITRWKTLQPLELSLAQLSIGFDVTDIHLRASLPKATPIARPQVRMEALSAAVFGGTFTLQEAQTWDFAAPSNHATLEAQQWQLRELVALQRSADIQAQGVLEGELPLTVEDGRIIIEHGYLRALPPGGSIRYQANDESRALAKSSPELALALELLSDFQYQMLSSAVELDKAGNLLLGLSLSGSNPEQYEGQPINFNINLEQNIDPLLQSLRLSDNLVEQIENRLK